MGESPAKMYMLATALTVLAILSVVLRFYARHIKKASLAWDDYLVLLAMVRMSTLFCVLYRQQ